MWINKRNLACKLEVDHKLDAPVDLEEHSRLLHGKDLLNNRDVLQPQINHGLVRLDPFPDKVRGLCIVHSGVIGGIIFDQRESDVVDLDRLADV